MSQTIPSREAIFDELAPQALALICETLAHIRTTVDGLAPSHRRREATFLLDRHVCRLRAQSDGAWVDADKDFRPAFVVRAAVDFLTRERAAALQLILGEDLDLRTIPEALP